MFQGPINAESTDSDAFGTLKTTYHGGALLMYRLFRLNIDAYRLDDIATRLKLFDKLKSEESC